MKFIRLILAVVLCLGVASAVHARMTKEEANILFQQANELYKQSKYQEAIEGYKKIIDSGLSSGAVHYNLGNCYMKTGELGEAVLSYERARQLRPRDGDVLSNLKYARSQVRYTTKIASFGAVIEFFKGFTEYYSINDFCLILAVLLGILIVVHLVKLFFALMRIVMSLVIICLVVMITIFSVGAIVKYQQVHNEAVVVQPTKARFEPLNDATVHYEIPEGVKVKWLREEGGWVKVERTDGLLGWVPRQMLERIEFGS